ncbi:MAG: ABC transporter ATP-binding protein [Aestuariivirgaceae bacterium]
MIDAVNLAKRFGPTIAVDDVSFSIGKGEVVGFLGPNGAGKSTTMRILSGFLVPDRGRARIAGYDVAQQTTAAQSSLGYMPEAAVGFGNLTAREFLLYCAQARGMSGSSARDAITSVAQRTALQPALDEEMRKLSKGWRQRAWFAQAVLHDPPVLVLDEPTDGLDPGQKAHVRSFVREIASGKAIILSTHILEEAEELCDRVIIISAGKIVADAPTASLLDGKGRLAPTFADLTETRPAA